MIHTFVVSRHNAGRPLVQLLQSELRLTRADAMSRLKRGQVRVGGQSCRDPERGLKLGQRVQVKITGAPAARRKAPEAKRPARRGLPRGKGIFVKYLDEHLVVVDKPAGMTTVRHADEAEAMGRRAQKFLPKTLMDLLPSILASAGVSPGRLRAVHRLDKETSGLLVLARTPEAEKHLGQQFRKHSVGRRYVALVRGQAQAQRIESTLVRDRGDGRRGSSTSLPGQSAITHVEVVEALGEFTLVECRLETGRTHQVRIHLGEAGTPLCGEHVYDRPLHGQAPSDTSGALRPMLHAATLEVAHPTTGDRMRWSIDLPADMRELLARLRANAKLPGSTG